MPDLSIHHLLIVAALILLMLLMLLIVWRLDCRAQRLEAKRRIDEARYREAQDALDRALKRRQDRTRNPEFRYTPE